MRSREQASYPFGKRTYSRLLTFVHSHSRESLAVEGGRRLTGDDVVRALEQVTAERGKRQTIRVDNGPAFVSQSVDLWASFNGVTLDSSSPGKPTDNAVIESFHGRLRDECLNQHWFLSLDEARAVTAAWRENSIAFVRMVLWVTGRRRSSRGR